MQPEVVSLGEPMVELCATTTGRLREVSTFKRGWGGDTSNFAVAVARLGHRAGYICRVGDDEFGKLFLNLWVREGMDKSNVIIEKGGFTGVYFISLVDSGEHDFSYYREGSAASHLSPEDIDENYVKQAKVFHSSGISQAISRSCCDAVFKAAEAAKGGGAMFSFDPNVRPRLWPMNVARAIINYTFTLSDIVFLSLEDAKLLYGFDEARKVASTVIKQGSKMVVIKLGANGCFVASKTEAFYSPGFKVKVVDTTGAGDAFDAAFIVGLLENWDLHRTATFANAVGALTTTGRGAVAPIPKKMKVQAFLKTTEATAKP